MQRLLKIRIVAILTVALHAVPCLAQFVPDDPLPPSPGSGATRLGNPPGAGSGRIGSAPGDVESVIIGRPGRPGARLPGDITRPGDSEPGRQAPTGINLPVVRGPLQVLGSGPLALPIGAEDPGPQDGLSLDVAINRLVHFNLDLRTQAIEIPQAQADILTASLRANPLLYADSTANPYGNFSPNRPGGPTQYDISITYPLDVTGRRKARTLVACRAKRVLEAQYMDAVRLQIDNLNNAFVDVLAARETVRFAEASLVGMDRLITTTENLLPAGSKTSPELNKVKIQRHVADVSLKNARGTLRRTKRSLAVLLNLPIAESESMEVRGTIRDEFPEPPSDGELIAIAMRSRPDLAAYRIGVSRAQADVMLSQANRYSDIFVNLAPYVFQNNAPFGKKSAHSWSASITAPLPVYNRNQGNIARSKLNVTQTQIALASLEEKIISEVLTADEDYDISRAAVAQLETELLPAASDVRENAMRMFAARETTLLIFLEAQREYNEVVGQYRDALIRHRRSMLDLNTAVGARLLP